MTHNEVYRELVLMFHADLFRITDGTTTPEAHRQAVQSFVDELTPWLDSNDSLPSPRLIFTLYDHLHIDEDTDEVLMQFSPEGECFFRAWARRKRSMLPCLEETNTLTI